jgi:1-acyl-sn-glycerol-3-phosphate acyltransferase
VGDQLPRRGNAVSGTLGRAALRLAGWTFEGTVPNRPKLVFIVAPHTSNWDFLIGIAAMFALGIRVTFFGKDTLFRPPFGVVMRWLGGIPVFRNSPHNVVEQTVDQVRAHPRIAVGLSPEGTRRKRPRWRSGFHFVARGAGVPIVPVALDYPARTIRLFALHEPADNLEADLKVLGSLFHAGMARHPAQY